MFRAKLSLGTAILWMTALMTGVAAPAQGNDAQLRSIGSLSASHIYTTYGYIGVLADAYVKDVYPGEKVKVMMSEVINIIDANMKNLQEVKSKGLSENDQKSIDNILEIYTLLKKQATALSKFSENRDRKFAQEFEAARTTVWPKVAKLLGIEQKK